MEPRPPSPNHAHTQPPHVPHPPARATHAPTPAPHAPPHHAPHAPSMRPPPSGSPLAKPSLVPQTGHVPTDKELEPLTLIEDDAPATPIGHAPPAAPKKIMAFGADAHVRKEKWKRSLLKTGTGATRVRSFHGKYSEQGLEYLDNAINEWLDNHEEIEVKFVTSTVMTFEGKIREPALVLNVWY